MRFQDLLLDRLKYEARKILLLRKPVKSLKYNKKKLLIAQAFLDIAAAALQSFGNAGATGAAIFQKGFERQNKEISEAEKRIEALREQLKLLLTEDIAVGGVETNVSSKNTANILTPFC